MHPVILIDLDGPLANFEQGFLNHWRGAQPNAFFLPLDQRHSERIADDYPKELYGDIRAVFKTKGFFRNLPPVPEGIQAVGDMVHSGLEVVICSSPIHDSPFCLNEKREWIERHLGKELARQAVFCKDKTLVKGGFLIDDREPIGRADAEWTWIIYDQPYNQQTEGLRLQADWSNWQNLLK